MLQLWIFRHWKYQYFATGCWQTVCVCVCMHVCVSRSGRWSNRGGVNLLPGKSLLLLLSSFCLSFFKYFIMLCWSAPSVLPLLFSSCPPFCSLLVTFSFALSLFPLFCLLCLLTFSPPWVYNPLVTVGVRPSSHHYAPTSMWRKPLWE